MAKEVAILTPEQIRLLELVSSDTYLQENFYFTGGTPLSAFYLQHRMSEDIDLFSEQEVSLPQIDKFIKKTKTKLKLVDIEYNQFLGLHTFQLFFSKNNVLKVDFNYYPFPRIEKGMKYLKISVDSLLDIAVNKVHTIFMQPRARDFIDIYFILEKEHYDLKDLVLKAKAKFDWHIDPVLLGTRLLTASTASDFPRMVKPIDHREWKDFFVAEAAKMKSDIFE